MKVCFKKSEEIYKRFYHIVFLEISKSFLLKAKGLEAKNKYCVGGKISIVLVGHLKTSKSNGMRICGIWNRNVGIYYQKNIIIRALLLEERFIWCFVYGKQLLMQIQISVGQLRLENILIRLRRSIPKLREKNQEAFLEILI